MYVQLLLLRCFRRNKQIRSEFVIFRMLVKSVVIHIKKEGRQFPLFFHTIECFDVMEWIIEILRLWKVSSILAKFPIGLLYQS